MKAKIFPMILTGLAALTILSCSSFLVGGRGENKIKYHITQTGEVEGFPVSIFYNDTECWRKIRIESPEGAYVEAEDYPTDCDNEFDAITAGGPKNIGHPLQKYENFEALEKLYEEIKSNPI